MADSIQNRMQADLKEAMKNKDAVKRDVLRQLSAAFKQTEVDERRELTETDFIAILKKEAKRRQESIADLEKAGRDTAAEKAEFELINSYLPEQLSREQVEALARESVAATGAASAKDMGKVMSHLIPRLEGRADGKLVSEVVRSLLA